MAKVRVRRLRLSPKQAAFHASDAPTRMYLGGRGSGKSYGLAADLLLRAAAAGGGYLVVAPTSQILNEGMGTALYDISTRLNLLHSVRGRPRVFKLINGSRIVLRTARNPELLRSGSYSGAILDEAALLSPLTLPIVRATLREHGRRGWVTLGSTPKGKFNFLFGLVAKGTFTVRAHSRDNPFVSEEFVESLVASYDDHYRRQEVEGEFLDEDEETQVLPGPWVEAAMKRPAPEPLPPLETVGIDTARGGSSRFTLAFRHGHHIPTLKAYPGARVKTSQDGAARVTTALGGPSKVKLNLDISGGTGSGVFDLLDSQGYQARAVNFAAATKMTDRHGRLQFANIRAAMYWALREALDPSLGSQALSLPDSHELGAELTSVHFFTNGSGAIQLEPKEKVAKVLRRSPDLADAVSLTMLN